MEAIEQHILQYMQNPNKPDRVRAENFRRPHKRPEDMAILPHEIYEKSLYSEKDVIKALQEMERKFLVESFIRGPRDELVIWFKPKEDN